MKVLISGGAGFVGLKLASRLLVAGCTVHLVDNRGSLTADSDFQEILRQPNAKFLEADCLNYGLLKNLDRDYTHMVHLAALLGVQNVSQNPLKTMEVNSNLTSNLVRLAVSQEHKPHFFYASTSEVYAGSNEANLLEFPTPEDSPIVLPDIRTPRSSYMVSKIQGEAFCAQSGLPYTIFRPHNLYGPRMGMRHVIPQLMHKMIASDCEDIEVFSPSHTRTFCYIDDAVEQLFILMTKLESRGQIFNIGDETPEINMWDLAKKIGNIVGQDPKIRHGEDTAGSPSRRCPQMTKCFDVTGYENKTSLDSGLKKTFLWYKENVF